MADMHQIYINLRSVKDQYWYIEAYQMEQQDIEEIIKEWQEERRNPTEDISDYDEDPKTGKGKEKDKVKENIGEQKEKELVGEKHSLSY